MADNFQYIKLPDGSFGKFDAAASDDVIKSAIQKDFPQAFASKKVTPSFQQQLTDKPDQPGLQPISTSPAEHVWNTIKGFGSEGVDTLKSLGSAVMGDSGIPAYEMAKGYFNSVQDTKQQADTAAAQGNPIKSGFMTAAAATPLVGPGAAKLYNLAEKGTPTDELIGRGGMQALQAFLMRSGTRAAATDTASAVKSNTGADAVFNKGAVADTISDAFNPHPDEVPSFKQNVAQHIDSIIQESGKVPTNRAELADAAQQSATKARADYRALADPVKDVQVSGGKTLGQLEARLSQINATLNPKYQKGGLTAVNALNAEQSAALTEEAASLRKTINTETAKQLGIKPEDVSAARQKYGQLGDVADKMRWYLDNENFSSNKVANQPANAPDISLLGGANMVRNAVWSKIMGNPADKAVADMLSRYVPGQKLPLQINPLDAGGSNPRQPAWRTANQSGTQLESLGDFTPDMSSAMNQQAIKNLIRRDARPQPSTPAPKVLSDLQKRAIQGALSNRSQR